MRRSPAQRLGLSSLEFQYGGVALTLLRRNLLAAGLGAFALPSTVFAAVPGRALTLQNLHTGEKLSATYWENGAYLPDALDAFNKVLRDHRTGEVSVMAPTLFDLLSTLNATLDNRQTVQIISGYRSPKTNAALHRASSGVATRSLHMDGKAMDIRIAGVDLPRLRDAALALRAGGVGYYQASNFVHVDVGRVRRW